MTDQQVRQAYMARQLAVGSYGYARKRGDVRATAQVEQAMLVRYAEYLLARDQLEKGVMLARSSLPRRPTTDSSGECPRDSEGPWVL